MSDKVYIIHNQDNLVLTKKNEWASGWDNKSIFRTPHKDIALNTLIEVNSKEPLQRIVLLDVETAEKGLLKLPDFIETTKPVVEETLDNEISDNEIPDNETAETAPPSSNNDNPQPLSA